MCLANHSSPPAHEHPGRDEPSFIEEASFIRAPLNSRVSMSPSVTNAKGKARMDSLDRVPIELQEAMVLEDLLFALVVSISLSSKFAQPRTKMFNNSTLWDSSYHILC